MSISDWFITAFIGIWLYVTMFFFTVGERTWGWLCLVILAAVGIAEVVSKVKHSRTITQRFKAFAALHPGKAVAILAGLGLAFVMLILHLVPRVWLGM